MLKGFKSFILRGNVIDLAVAVVIGVAFAAVVKAVVADILTPLITAIAGKPNFGSLKFTIHHSQFAYGDVINNLITFLSIAAVVYFVIVAPINALNARRKAGREDSDDIPPDIALLTEIRDLLAGSSGEQPTTDS